MDSKEFLGRMWDLGYHSQRDIARALINGGYLNYRGKRGKMYTPKLKNISSYLNQILMGKANITEDYLKGIMEISNNDSIILDYLKSIKPVSSSEKRYKSRLEEQLEDNMNYYYKNFKNFFSEATGENKIKVYRDFIEFIDTYELTHQEFLNKELL